MNYVLIAAVVTCGALGALVLVLVRRLAAAPQVSLEPADVSRLLSDRYRPMGRLLAPADALFLASHPAASAKQVRQFRSRRRKIFRAYLRSMVKDFNRISGAIKLLLATSEEDNPELATAVIKQQIIFQFALAAVQCRLVLHACGLGTVDVGGLTAVLDGMRLELSRLMPAPAAIPA